MNESLVFEFPDSFLENPVKTENQKLEIIVPFCNTLFNSQTFSSSLRILSNLQASFPVLRTLTFLFQVLNTLFFLRKYCL